MILRPFKRIKELEMIISTYESKTKQLTNENKELNEKIDSMTHQELYNPGVLCEGCKHHFTEKDYYGTYHYCTKNCLCKGREE
jgi:hypothetical protein